MRHQFLLGAAIVALAVPAAVSAQETTATIRGSVTGAGTPVAGATVVATDVQSGTKSQTVTGADGGFSLTGLRVGGPYTVEITSSMGNKTVTDIFTVQGQTFTLPVEVAEAATDNTPADIIVTASSIRGAGGTSDGPQSVFTQADVRKVASVNRDIRDIERRDPFATLDLANSRAVSFAGVNPRFNRFTINGVQVGDQFGLNPDASPTGRGPIPFDAIGQVSVSIAPYDIRQTGFTGGVIDTQVLSGTNDFHGTGFYSQSTNRIQGNRIGSNLFTVPNYKSETYGATFRGPIIADKLFFMVSAERNTDPRPLTPNSIAGVPGLTAAQLASVQGTAQSVYGYNTGGILAITQNKDEKIVGRIDWNVTTGQRLSLTYGNAYDQFDQNQNTSSSATTPSIGLASDGYRTTELLRYGIAQLNSDWTDHFSTEARFIYRSTTRGQLPLQGNGFAQFGVCVDPTSINVGANTTSSCSTGTPRIFFGPDLSRQTNTLFTDTYQGSLLARLQAGQHDIKLLAEYAENRTTDVFLQRSAGVYYFDSLADFQNRNASQFDYAVSVSGNVNDIAQAFKYGVYSAGFQDDWRVTDTLTVTYGMRYDLYGQRTQVAFNPNFLARSGFTNTKTFKGLDNFQPRISFSWKPDSALRLRGGAGVFGGGNPDIYLSNSFGPGTGIASNRIATVTRATAVGTATATCNAPYNTPATANICTAALNGVTGSSIPAAVTQFAQTNTASLTVAPTAELSPRFHEPSVLKATLSADYKLYGFNFGVDYLYTNTLHQIAFRDARAVQIGTLPDGRPRYNAITLYNGQVATTGLGTDTNYDIELYDDSRGRAHIGVVRVNKDFDFGLSLGASYTRQDVKDSSPATSSVALSIYSAQQALDPNSPTYGRSNDETTWAYKYSVGYDHAFFRDYKTTFQLFGETRAGRRYSYTMNTTTGRSAVFGTVGNTDRYLLYVPTGLTDPIVSYDTTTTQTNLDALIGRTLLNRYRGRIADKNIARSRAFTRIDLHLEQELPTFLGSSRVSVFGDIENLPNLINHNWGGLRQLGFPYTSAVVQVQCLTTPVATGTTPTAAQIATSPTQTCAQYRYSTERDPNDAVPSVANSLYLIRIGARFSF